MSGVHWLPLRANVQRALRWSEFLLPLFVGAMLVGGLTIYAATGALVGEETDGMAAAYRARLSYLLLIAAAGLLLIFPIVLPAIRALRRQVGSDGMRIYLRLGDGREKVVTPTELVHTKRAILYRQYSFPLRNQKGRSFYADGELETHLEPILERARTLSPWEGLRHQWRHRDAALLWPLGSTCVLLLLLALALALQLIAPIT